jgi:hypothetical protein
MRENSATHLPELIIDCPACASTGWVKVISDRHPVLQDVTALTIACPVCDGRSWIEAVTR